MMTHQQKGPSFLSPFLSFLLPFPPFFPLLHFLSPPFPFSSFAFPSLLFPPYPSLLCSPFLSPFTPLLFISLPSSPLLIPPLFLLPFPSFSTLPFTFFLFFLPSLSFPFFLFPSLHYPSLPSLLPIPFTLLLPLRPMPPNRSSLLPFLSFLLFFPSLLLPLSCRRERSVLVICYLTLGV